MIIFTIKNHIKQGNLVSMRRDFYVDYEKKDEKKKEPFHEEQLFFL